MHFVNPADYTHPFTITDGSVKITPIDMSYKIVFPLSKTNTVEIKLVRGNINEAERDMLLKLIELIPTIEEG